MMYLGRNTSSGERVNISEKDRRLHMHVVGSTGTGKSFFLEGMIRQDILAGRGFCLIDPTGDLYKRVVRWITSHYLHERRKIVLFDPTEEGWAIGFNPLLSDFEPSFLVDNMVKAIAKVWGGEDQDRTPLLKRCLRLILYVLAENKLSLLEAQRLINPDDATLRNHLIRNISDPTIREEWEFLNNRTRSQFVEDFASTRNRLMEFISSPAVKNIIGQTETVMDFKKIMEEGHVVLVNLQPQGRLTWDNARLLGTLIVNELFVNALTREDGAKSYYLYIDECSLFLNEDIGYILDLCRKKGLHLIMAHQHLGQLRDVGEKIYRSVMTDARAKAIFGGLEFEDAEVFVKNLFLDIADLQEWKIKLTRPTIVGYSRIWFENYAKSKGYSLGTTTTEGGGSAVTMVQGSGAATAKRSDSPGADTIETISSQDSRAATTSQHAERGTTEVKSEGESEGGSEGLEPIFKDLPVESYSLEEQVWRRVALMVNQQTQHAIIKLPDKKSVFVKTPTIKLGFADKERVKNFKEQSYLSTYFIKAVADAEREIEDRKQRLLDQAKAPAIVPVRAIKQGQAQHEVFPPDFGDDEPPPDVKVDVARKISQTKKEKN